MSFQRHENILFNIDSKNDNAFQDTPSNTNLPCKVEFIAYGITSFLLKVE